MSSSSKFKLSSDDFYKGCCGKIFLTNKKLLVMHCALCDAKFGSFRRFVDHLSAEHYYDWRFFGSKARSSNTTTNHVNNKLSTKPNHNKPRDTNISETIEHEKEPPAQCQEQLMKSDDQQQQTQQCDDNIIDCEEVEEEEHQGVDVAANQEIDDEPIISEFTIQELVPSLEEEAVEQKDTKVEAEEACADFLKESCGINIDSTITAEELDENHTFFLSDDENEYTEKNNVHGNAEPDAGANGNSENDKSEWGDLANNDVYNIMRRKKYRIDNKERNHICDICNASFTDRSNLMSHKRRHSGQKDHVCPECPKRFYTRSELKTHICFHTRERPFICSTCGRGFLTSGAMTGHMRRHTNERRYKCDYCDKRFFDSTQLKDHTVSHTKVREYSCEECQATFMLYKTLKQHMKIHANKREYVCYICQAAFNQSPALFLHMKKHGVKLHQNN